MNANQVTSALARAGALHEPGVISVYLFGSVAEHRSHRESDVDVAVLFDYRVRPTMRDRFEARLRLFAELTRTLKTDRLDLVVLNDAPPLLARRAVTEGARVLCADPDRDHDFVRDIQLRAADLLPFLRRTARLKLDAIARS